jgi:hypothetical protein
MDQRILLGPGTTPESPVTPLIPVEPVTDPEEVTQPAAAIKPITYVVNNLNSRSLVGIYNTQASFLAATHD